MPIRPSSGKYPSWHDGLVGLEAGDDGPDYGEWIAPKCLNLKLLCLGKNLPYFATFDTIIRM
ncbi:MAG: hypothetical protein NTX52_15575 [Planctomycetota bacterium]|nr:hypothetical protein [Planctomycetota bacterium]